MTRNATFAVLVLIIGFAFVSEMDYADQKLIEAMKKERREQYVRSGGSEGAPIYSARCLREGRDMIATQSDGGIMRIACTGEKAPRRP